MPSFLAVAPLVQRVTKNDLLEKAKGTFLALQHSSDQLSRQRLGQAMKSKQHGFTLIEIAIVLVIIGLLLGGILKGQELITNARVRNLISQQDGIKAAFFGFQDRYRALPGDYTLATTNIPNVSTAAACGNGNGNGNGQVATVNAENILAWDHLSKAGFITGSFTCAGTTESPTSAPTNPYTRYFQLVFDNVYADPTPTPRHNVKTGNLIPSDILAEVDRKVDDGNAQSGAFRFSSYGGNTGASALTGTCHTAGTWTIPAVTDCGGASLF
jgi:prepilin-type N-terminal cleavage/methylation domain-containing protein